MSIFQGLLDHFSERNKPKTIRLDQRVLYVVPQVHVDEANRNSRLLSFLDPTYIDRYHQYATNLRKQLLQDGVSPKNCVLYLEMLAVTANIHKATHNLRRARKELRHDLITTFVLPLVDEGATLVGAENRELLEPEIGNTQEGVHARDQFIAETITSSLPPGMVGILVIGYGHNVERYLSESEVPVRSMRLLFDTFKEANAQKMGKEL